MKKENNVKTFEWIEVLLIPRYMILDIGDNGVCETYESVANGEQTRIEADDLRISVGVSGGHRILIPVNGRLVICENGDIIVEALMEV